MPISDYTPTLAQVGALLRTRTKDSSGNEIGTFNSDTRPTDTDVNELIAQAVDTFALRAGTDIPDILFQEAQRLVAMRAAMLVEVSYFPEMVAMGHSPYAQYEALWTEGFGDHKSFGVLIQAIEMAKADADKLEPIDPGMAQFNFPPASNMATRPW